MLSQWQQNCYPLAMSPLVQYLVRSLKEEAIYKNSDILHRESHILRLISLAYLTDKTVTVSDLLKNTDLGSTPTIQMHIRKLVDKQLVRYGDNPDDRRLKYLLPTEKAIELFTQLCQARIDHPAGDAR